MIIRSNEQVGTDKLYGYDSISFILCNGMQTAMGCSKEQGISTNNCKDKDSTTLTTVKTKDHQQM